MIYVFDDRAQRRTINSERLKDFSDLVIFKTIEIIPERKIEECVIYSVDNPDCIIFHKSYTFEDKSITFETIRQLFTSYNVPIVIFSGGTEGSNKGDIEVNMNADLMYENLPFFLEDYKTNGKINISTLLWGKRYKLNALLQLQNSLSLSFLVNNEPEGIIDNIENVKRKIRNNCRTLGLTAIGEKIIADIDKLGQLTWLNFAAIIENNIKTDN